MSPPMHPTSDQPPTLALTLDTSSHLTTMALVTYGHPRGEPRDSPPTDYTILESAALEEPREQTRLGVTMIDKLLTSTGNSYGDISSIIYVRGPGSFTGIRAGCAMVAGFHVANPELSLYGVSGFDVLATSLMEGGDAEDHDATLILLETMRSDYYFWALRHGPSTKGTAGEDWTAPVTLCATTEEVLAFMRQYPRAKLAGNAWDRFFRQCHEDTALQKVFPTDVVSSMRADALSHPSATLVAQAWPTLAAQGKFVRGVDPLYMRPAYVHEKRQQKPPITPLCP